MIVGTPDQVVKKLQRRHRRSGSTVSWPNSTPGSLIPHALGTRTYWRASPGWRTFMRSHAPSIAAMDLFVVPTIGFKLLYAFVIVRLDCRDLVWINVTAHPTTEWVAHQITDAFPWNEAPRCVIRDRDCIYSAVVTRRLRAMGIRDRPIALASPAEWFCRTADRIDPA
jgi:hypothetical protein